MNRFLLQSFLRSLRPPEGGPWVKNWEFGSKTNDSEISIISFLNKIMSFGKTPPQQQDPWGISANVNNIFGLFITHFFTNPTPGASSHDCILRSLCEVARTPQNQDGLFGDFINLLLAPSYILDQPSESFKDSDYLEAQRTGHFLQDCSRYERSCPMSLFEVRILNFQKYFY